MERSLFSAATVAKARSSLHVSRVCAIVGSGPQDRPARCAATTELSAAIKGHLGPPRRPHTVSSMVKAHQRAQLPVLQTEARD
eukprot:2029582-Lingulodinium_polyedra.AAC.1